MKKEVTSKEINTIDLNRRPALKKFIEQENARNKNTDTRHLPDGGQGRKLANE